MTKTLRREVEADELDYFSIFADDVDDISQMSFRILGVALSIDSRNGSKLRKTRLSILMKMKMFSTFLIY